VGGRAAQGKFPQGGLPRHAGPQRCLHSLRMFAGVGWMAGIQCRWGRSLGTGAPFRFAGHSDRYIAVASGALAATFAVTRFRFGKPDASLCANGWLAGLVASSACAATVSPVQALVIGIVAGIITPLLVEVLELAVSIDDPSGAITVHAAGGLWD